MRTKISKLSNYEFYKKNGYCIFNLFNKSDINVIRKALIKRINFLAERKIFNLNNYKLEKYHKLVNKKLHNKLMNPDTRYIKLPKKIVKKIFRPDVLFLFKQEWGHTYCAPTFVGNAEKKNYIRNNAAGFRLARPKNKQDVAPEHLDANYGGKIINNFSLTKTIWIPIIGFSSKYTVRFAPESHKFVHNANLVKRGGKVTPSFSKKYVSKFKFVQPNLNTGQAVLLHPNLLHGSSVNKGSFSRMSLNCSIFNRKLLSEHIIA